MNENRAMSKTESSDASADQNVKAEQSSGSNTEKHPNLTLLESGQNPGEILRAAREKAGLSLSDISEQTKINEKQLLAIESGDVARLPPETFAKAFIKSYCKALKMDPVPVILSFGFSDSSAQSKTSRPGHSEGGRGEPLEPKMPNSSKRLSTLNFDRKTGKKSLSYGIVLAAVVVMAVFYIPVFLSNSDVQTGDAETIDPNEAPAVVLAPSADTPVQNDVTLPSNLNAPAVAGDTAIFPALQQPSTVESGATGTAAPVAAGPNVIRSDSAASPGAPTTTPAQVQGKPVPAETPPLAATAAPATGTNPAITAVSPAVNSVATSGEGLLRFKFQEQSWVTIRDANDKVLISQLNDAGSNLEVRGQAPFKLIVGNARTVSVSTNGKPFDLSSSIRGEVARVTVQ